MEGVTSIGEYAFYLCTGLESVTIPDSVTAIYGNPFVGCPFTAVNIPSGNPAYAFVSGVLFDKRDHTLVTFPRAMQGVYDIPQSIISIGNSAFGECGGLTSVTIPASVTRIGGYAFYECDNVVLNVKERSFAEQYTKDNGIVYTNI